MTVSVVVNSHRDLPFVVDLHVTPFDPTTPLLEGHDRGQAASVLKTDVALTTLGVHDQLGHQLLM